MPIVLNIDAIAAGDRAEVWHDSCARTFVGVDVRPALDEPIGGRVRAYDLGDLVVGEIDASGQGMARTQQLIDRTDEQYLLLTLQTRGTGRVAQGDRRTLLRPGECAIFESHRPFELNFDAAFDVWVFGFPRHLVRLAEHERRQLAAQSVSFRTGLAGVASRALQDLALHSEDLAGEPPGSVLSMANDLVVTMFAEHLPKNSERGGALQATMPMRVKHYIDQRLADPALAPGDVAAAFGISTRYLHRLFETEHETVAQYIRDRRLERCRLQLLDPRLSGHTISTLAHGCGFGDLSGFNRAFWAKYGMTPRQLRMPSPGHGQNRAGCPHARTPGRHRGRTGP
ncbi:helix-turn-helix domain-containing protein [Pseudonocardia aurantiaca]|uniref:Helix-turn-helix domain-containing protein n=1 Tax=Pseudonocardia aurantiaca TaxID=75290 RepID=A0ABW4FSX1_9PSEU